ncbi:MAG TPA: hypothetical protein VK717_11870 [Opitutaceae bacterium]|jgi:hypothetical protein|nr:hypothetical protein [Opitutaceae bacterium]
MKKCLFLLVLMLATGVRSHAAAEKLSCAPEIRKASLADDTLFHDLLSAPGGVAMADEVFFPSAKERKVVRIEVKVPYDGRKPGTEKWTVEHAEGDAVSYNVSLIPDGRGGATFAVQKDNGNIPGSTSHEAEGTPAFTFLGVKYFYHWSQGDQRMFTPKGQNDAGTWSDMIMIGRYPAVRDGASLFAMANMILANFKKNGAFVLGARSIPGKNGQAAEHFIAIIHGQRGVAMEADFSRIKLSDGMGYILAYQHRIHGAEVGNQMSAWLKVSGPAIEQELLNWDANLSTNFPPALSSLAPQ